MSATARTLAVVLARGGSKGLPDKNLRLLAGEPLVARPIRHALESGVVDDVVLSTDSERIAEAGRAAGAQVPFVRPAELAGDLATTESGLRHALLEYERLSGRAFDVCVFLSPADVFRRPEWIREAVTLLRSRPELESVFAGHATHKNFWERREDGSWERVRDWMAVYSSRQVRRPVVREDTGLACASRASLWREGRRIGDRVEIIVNDDAFTAIDIHDEEDLRLAEAALRIRGGA
ncbi:MAG: cytidylyltransferase domain-containing protein [Ilumatobacteraceae bacterium]|jgi:CMP-N-acetylneuraminic acid synthetase